MSEATQAAAATPGIDARIICSGVPGQIFNLDIKDVTDKELEDPAFGFGAFKAPVEFIAPGTVTVGGRATIVTRWTSRSIKGKLASDTDGGEVIVQRGAKTWKTWFGKKPIAPVVAK